MTARTSVLGHDVVYALSVTTCRAWLAAHACPPSMLALLFAPLGDVDPGTVDTVLASITQRKSCPLLEGRVPVECGGNRYPWQRALTARLAVLEHLCLELRATAPTGRECRALHQYLDAHLFAALDACATPATATLHHPPSSATVFGLALLPDLEQDVVAALCLPSGKDTAWTQLLRMAGPTKGDTKRAARAAQACPRRDTTLVWLATQLGLWWHCTHHAPLAARLALYARYLWRRRRDDDDSSPDDAAPPTAAAAAALAAVIGVPQPLPTAAQWPAAQRQWARDIPGDQLAVAAAECVVGHLEWLGWLRRALETTTPMVRFMDDVRQRGDAVRRGVPVPAVPAPVYCLADVPFWEAMRRGATTVLVTRGASEQPVDAIWPPVWSTLLHRVVRGLRYTRPWSISPMLGVPPVDASRAVLRQTIVEAHLFPLEYFYVSKQTILALQSLQERYDGAMHMIHGFFAWLQTQSLFQVQVVSDFAHACVNAATIHAFPLPLHLAERQLAAARERSDVVSFDAVSTFVCMCCRTFCGDTMQPGKVAASTGVPKFTDTSWGSSGVMMASATKEDAFDLATLPDWQYMRLLGTEHGTLHAWFGHVASAETWPEQVEVATRPFQLPVVPVQPDRPRHWQAGVGLGITATTPAARQYFMDRWRAVSGQHVVGHAARGPDERAVKWVCASKNCKREYRKSTSEFDDRGILGAITVAERARAEALRDSKRRRVKRQFAAYTECHRTRVWHVSLLGWAVRVDRTTYVACCQCLSYTTLDDARWIGETLVCAKCVWLHRCGQTGTTVTRVRCLVCKRSPGPAEAFATATVWDDTNVGNETFTAIRVCPNHARQAPWLWRAPNILSLSVVTAGFAAKWKNLRQWNPTDDYLKQTLHADLDDDVQNAVSYVPKTAKHTSLAHA